MNPASVVVALLLIAHAAYTQQLQVDDQQSSVTFRIRNFGLEVEGTLSKVSGTVVFDPSNIEASSFRLSADPATIDTGISLRDKHLQKNEYLDAGKYKTIDFVSTRVARMDGNVVVTGNLTIKGTTKEILVPVNITPMMEFDGSFTINRLDYKVGSGSFSLADEITVVFSIRTRKI